MWPQVRGPDHMMVVLKDGEGGRLTGWSLTADGRPPAPRAEGVRLVQVGRRGKSVRRQTHNRTDFPLLPSAGEGRRKKNGGGQRIIIFRRR